MLPGVEGVEPSRRETYNAAMPRAGIRLFALIAIALLALQAPLDAHADTGLPLPRFASLRATKVYMRTGPGFRYPVEWVYTFRGMPVEIVAEFNHWRKVRDWQGSEGWVHSSMLSGQRTGIVMGGIQPLRSDPKPDAPMVARVEEKVLAKILECTGKWCRIDAAGMRGWIRRAHLWGVYPNETLN